MPELGINGQRISENGNSEEVALAESPSNSPPIEVHFEPIIQLPLVEVSTNEEEEHEMIKLRAKLYRYDTTDSPAEWKERGTGEVKLLRHKTKNTVRIVMRRDKTLKICANHFVWPWMELNPNCGSDRAWVWSALADFADEQPKPQLLAIRFANVENAKLWKETFDKAKKIVESECEAYSGKPDIDESETEISCSDSEEESKIIKQDTEITSTSSKIEDKQDKVELTKTSDVTTDLENLKVQEQK
ncbi:PREDICTED: ran-specific GTPase-activating protein-like [Ceratosolen solmsi marchali]|uniref:Ran-specific GTPase-activating protein-like n=1 Tax=Ceratosolen solmsi marchali TaxID=326594 RepID=A0AAJ6YKG6_9HYME|nr:PREDICTED: ran-specific GTPase-activating protein-like [Ceratosolen solmsi marchali]